MIRRNRQVKKSERANHRNIVSHVDPKSPIAEQYRTLRTNIQYSSSEVQMKSILVTSASPGEGKSTTIANLAVVLSQQGKRVLLVDADMRKPTVHYTFRVDNLVGLTNLLTGQEKIEGVIQATRVSNLSVIPCGPIPPNPSELLGSNRMQQVLDELLTEFDYVLFDAPPVLAVADPIVLANLCDGSVLVVSSGKTDRDGALKAKEQLDQSKAKLLGAVLNEKPRSTDQYYYYYGGSK